MIDLKQYLLDNIPNSKIASGGREVQTRCIFCGDSQDPNGKHLYIKVPRDNEISVYHCFKCTESGILDGKFLRQYEIYDAEIIASINKNNSIASKMNGTSIDKDNKPSKLFNTYITDNDLSKAKLNYINKRLGLSLTYDDLLKNKIVLNLWDLLHENNIKKLTRNEQIVNQLNESFLGFISLDNSFINMKNLRPGKVYSGIDKKYVNYNIFGKIDNSQRYYIIPNSINLLDPNPIKIHISEGSFDNLSIFHNLNNGYSNNSIYASIGGKAYLNIIKFFIVTKGLMNIELHLYPDADIEQYTMNNISNFLSPYNIDIFIHRNIYPDRKDMGVRLSEIKENIFHINKRY